MSLLLYAKPIFGVSLGNAVGALVLVKEARPGTGAVFDNKNVTTDQDVQVYVETQLPSWYSAAMVSNSFSNGSAITWNQTSSGTAK